jgi:hypothetical protein
MIFSENRYTLFRIKLQYFDHPAPGWREDFGRL